MGWNHLSTPKLQRCNRGSLGMDKLFHPIHYNGCNYLSMLGLKLNHVSKRGPRYENQLELPSLSDHWQLWSSICISSVCIPWSSYKHASTSALFWICQSCISGSTGYASHSSPAKTPVCLCWWWLCRDAPATTHGESAYSKLEKNGYCLGGILKSHPRYLNPRKQYCRNSSILQTRT